MDVFVCFHVRLKDDDNEDVKLLGVFSTLAKADAAIEALKAQPGFCDYPDGFSRDQYTIDQRNWSDGFGV